MPTDLAITLVSAFGIFFIGIVVYFHDRKSISNILFFLIALATVLWAIANYFSLNINPPQVLFWIRLVLFFATPHAVLFFIFTYNFPNRGLVIKRTLFIASLLLLLITMGATVSPYVFTRIEAIDDRIVPIAGPLMPLFALVVVISLISGIILIVRKFIKAQTLERMQWRSMLIGVSLSYFLLILTNFLFVIFLKDTSFIIYGPLFMLPTFVGMAYAILRHHLLNVKAIATEILTFVILSVSLFEIFVAKNTFELILRIVIFILFFTFGIFLIKSVLKEVEQRERLEKLTKELEAANARLRELDQLKSEFLSFASHQVKSPMAVIKGFAELISDGTYGPVSDEAKAKAKKIKESADRTIVLVNNLLDLRKIEEGKMEYKFEEVDIVALLSSMVEEFKPLAAAKGLDLQFQAYSNVLKNIRISADAKLSITNQPLPSIKIKADPEKIRQVIQNIIDNAIKYTDRGYVKVTVDQRPTTSNQKPETVLITVEDTGRGMSKEMQSQAFERFTRDESVKKEIQGTGLGLYIAREIVTAHHGEIWAESEGEGQGSRFFVRLRNS